MSAPPVAMSIRRIVRSAVIPAQQVPPARREPRARRPALRLIWAISSKLAFISAGVAGRTSRISRRVERGGV